MVIPLQSEPLESLFVRLEVVEVVSQTFYCVLLLLSSLLLMALMMMKELMHDVGGL